MYKHIELRKLPVDELCNIVNILEINNDWKRVMSIIPKELNSDYFEPKYNNEHIRYVFYNFEIYNELFNILASSII